jgi:2-polyprenyl-6-methoxyphenol hydroxylase-like FAD-dependent oxidoreductase
MNPSPTPEARYDAVVVGARVAGAATAMLLARAGLRVLVVDRSRRGSDTLSTLALMRAGVMQLHRWGVLPRLVAAGTPPVRRTTFHYGSEPVQVDIKDRDGVDALFAPRRTLLDVVLADAALESGAQVLYGATVREILRVPTGRVQGVLVTDEVGRQHRVEADLVIGADGARSTVGRAVNARVLCAGKHPGSYVYSYWQGLDLDGTHWHYAPGVAAGAIPTNDGLSCVFVGMPPSRFRVRPAVSLDGLFQHVVSECHHGLARALRGARRVGKCYSFAGREGFLRQPWGEGWALVGDAACFKDPITAHGMTDALRDAELLARAVIRGTTGALADYQEERDSFAVEFCELSDRIASFDWDLDHLQVLHHRLSRLMARECECVRDFDTVQRTPMRETAHSTGGIRRLGSPVPIPV